MAPIAFVVGLLFGALGMLFTAKVPTIDAFSFAVYLLVTPMFLFSGAFFPLSQLPEGVQGVALALPLTHAVALTRAVVAGDLAAVDPWGVAYLLAACVLLPWWALGWVRKRVVKWGVACAYVLSPRSFLPSSVLATASSLSVVSTMNMPTSPPTAAMP